MSAMFPGHPQFARQSGIPNLIRVEIGDAYSHPVFYLECANIMQERSPAFVFRQVLSHMTGKKNVTGVSAIHHPLRNINTGSRYIGAVIYIGDLVYGAAVDTHSNPKFGIIPERLTNLQSTAHWLFRAVSKDQSHPVPCR